MKAEIVWNGTPLSWFRATIARRCDTAGYTFSIARDASIIHATMTRATFAAIATHSQFISGKELDL